MHKVNSFTSENLGRDTLFSETKNNNLSEMNIINTRLAGLGISMSDGFSMTDEDEEYTQYEDDKHIARLCILDGKAVPKDVEQRLLDRVYKGIKSLNTVDITITDEELEAFLNETK